MNRDLKVTHRPQTGMKSVHQTNDARQVKDRKYYEGLLRKRIKEVYTEKQRLKGEISQAKKNRAKSKEFAKQQDHLNTEIKTYDNKLRSLNILIQNIQKDENLMPWLKDEINKHNSIRTTLEKETDEILSKRKDLEDFILMIETKRKDIESNFHRILEENPDEKLKYLSLREEGDKINSLVEDGKEMLSKKSALLKRVKKEIEKDPKKMGYLKKLEKKQGILEALKQAKKKLFLYKNEHVEIKKQNQKLKVELRRIITDIKNYEKMKNELILRINEKQKRLSVYQNEKGIYRNYMSLKEKDAKLNNFIQIYPDKLQSTKDEIQINQQIIVELTDFISRTMEKNLVDLDGAGSNYMDQLSEGQRFRDTALSTLETLKRQVDLKKKQSENVTKINHRIISQLKQMNVDIARMKKELVMYNKVDQLKVRYESAEKSLEKKKKWLTEMKTYQENALKRLQRYKEQQLKKLSMSNVLEALKDLERKVQHFASNNDKIAKYIKEKEKEIDFTYIKNKCLELMAMLNELLCNTLSDQTTHYDNV